MSRQTASTPRFRPVLDQFAPYKPGKPPTEIAGRSYKLSSNESPFGPLPSVLKAIAETAAEVHRYPDSRAVELSSAIAARLDVPASHVAVGCGSVGIVQQLLEAVVDPGAEVLYAWRSFEAYPYLSDLAGAVSVTVPLRGEAHDLDAMAAAITPATRLIFLCTPNNPTGPALAADELTGFLDQVPGDCLVVLDEAYVQYVRDPAVPDGVAVYRDRPNVAVVRTFSKAYGLAGLRVGYLIGHEAVAAAARKTMLTFSVNVLAQTAALASLAAEDELLERVELVVAERERVRAALLATGWPVAPSEANFLWLRIGDQSREFTQACDSAGIAVRPFGTEGVRVTIGEKVANDAFLSVASEYSGKLRITG
ncbi:MAG TPA: histidinol-phosphate transaminase [Streptosporangiaceae bacterium]|nr:histidinol-phosphate transaminase [Streptosporangiaceae bacterium]